MFWKLALAALAVAQCGVASASIVDISASGRLYSGDDGLNAGDPLTINASYDNAGPGEDESGGLGGLYDYPGDFSVNFTLNGQSYHNAVNYNLETYMEGGVYVLGLGTPGDYTGPRAEIEINLPSSYVPGGDLPTADAFRGSSGTVAFQFIPNGDPESYFADGNANFRVGSVPEAATWAMMIGGFGMIGGAMRRKRSVNASKVLFA